MGASSVTGVGYGAAGMQKGPGNNRNYFVPLTDAHIVQQGTIYTDDGSVTVQLRSDVQDAPEKLMILCSGKAWSVDKNVTDGVCLSFDIEGAKKTDIDYVVIKHEGGSFVNT